MQSAAAGRRVGFARAVRVQSRRRQAQCDRCGNRTFERGPGRPGRHGRAAGRYGRLDPLSGRHPGYPMKVFERTKEMTSTQTKLMRIALTVIVGTLAIMVGFGGPYLDLG